MKAKAILSRHKYKSKAKLLSKVMRNEKEQTFHDFFSFKFLQLHVTFVYVLKTPMMRLRFSNRKVAPVRETNKNKEIQNRN